MVTIVDPILLILLFLFALRGYFKGLFRESFSLVGLVAGFMVAVRYDERVAALLSNSWNYSLIILKAGAFIVLFFAVYFASSLMGWLLNRFAKFLFLQGVNRIGGVLLGAGKGASVLALVVFFLLSFPLTPQQWQQKIHDSYLASSLYQFAEVLVRFGKTSIFPRQGSETASGEGSALF